MRIEKELFMECFVCIFDESCRWYAIPKILLSGGNIYEMILLVDRGTCVYVCNLARVVI